MVLVDILQTRETLLPGNKRIIKYSDQKGDRVSQNDKRCHICSIKLFSRTYEKYGTLSKYLDVYVSTIHKIFYLF